MSEVMTVPNGAMFSLIERAARDESFDVAKFEALLRMRREEQAEQAKRAFNVAMRDCQAEMEPVLRGTPNKGVGGRYAKLEDIDQQMRPSYTSHGFSVRYGSDPPPQPGWMRITCTVAHEAGYWEQNYLDSPVSNTGSQGGRMGMTPVQAVGATVTYLRRYLLAMSFNIVLADIARDDKDGEEQRGGARDSATQRPPPPQRTQEQWLTWVSKLRDACAVLRTEQEHDEVGRRQTMRDILGSPDTPDWVKEEAFAILADTRERIIKAKTAATAPAGEDDGPPTAG